MRYEEQVKIRGLQKKLDKMTNDQKKGLLWLLMFKLPPEDVNSVYNDVNSARQSVAMSDLDEALPVNGNY